MISSYPVRAMILPLVGAETTRPRAVLGMITSLVVLATTRLSVVLAMTR